MNEKTLPRFVMLGGFLGAGKTTTISKLARHYQDLGQRVAIVTNDTKMKELIQIVTHVASSSASVFIQGESGTGKELIAKLLHLSNQNVCGPFVAVNCAALPENLLESELFGHKRGSFTDGPTPTSGRMKSLATKV